jgi:hypothetical protein
MTEKALKEALFTELKNNSAIAALVGDGGSGYNIYPLKCPDGVTLGAAITYSVISRRKQLIKGIPRFQLTCMAPTYAVACDLADKVRAALDDHSEHLLGGTVPVNYIKVGNQTEFFEPKGAMYQIAVEVDLTVRYN